MRLGLKGAGSADLAAAKARKVNESLAKVSRSIRLFLKILQQIYKRNCQPAIMAEPSSSKYVLREKAGSEADPTAPKAHAITYNYWGRFGRDI